MSVQRNAITIDPWLGRVGPNMRSEKSTRMLHRFIDRA